MGKITTTIICALLFSISALFAQTAAEKIAIEGVELKNIYRIDRGVYRSEQPSRSDFVALEKFGITEVLSLRYWNDDTDEAHDTSLTLHSLPTKASKINQAEIIQALKIIRNRRGAILIHCWHGSDRTGAVCAMYRVVFQGWSKESAIDEMVNGNFGFHKQFSQIIDVINNADVEFIRREIGLK